MDTVAKSPLYVIGHRNPDTDAICAAIGNAAYLRENGYPEAVPARCGHMPRRTEWALERAGIPKPVYIRSVYPTAGSLCKRSVVSVTANNTFLEAYRLMEQVGLLSLPVLNDDSTMCGLIQFMDLLGLLMPAELEEYSSLRNVQSNLEGICSTLNAENITGTELASKDEELITVIAASSELTLWRRLERYKNEGQINQVVLVCGDRSNVQRYAVELGVKALILTANYAPPAEIIALAHENGTVILLTDLDTASVSQLIRFSRPVHNIIQKDFETFPESLRLDEIRTRVSHLSQGVYPVVDNVTEKVTGIFTKADLVDPTRMRVALVDHNEVAQAVYGIEEADVVEILDHHRLGNSIVSRNPIRITVEPVGSTSTLVARRFFDRNSVPEKGIALCLCAGILSDTINLTSPTTTRLDKEVLARLCEIAEVDPAEFTAEFFAAGSLLKSGDSPDVIINADRKEFVEQGHKISISQIEEVGMSGFEEVRAGLLAALQKLVEENKYDFACLLITDVSSYDSLLLVAGDPYIINEIPYMRIDRDMFRAPGVVSRKKQLFPDLSAALRRSNNGVS